MGEIIAFGWAALSRDFAGVALPLAVAGLVLWLPGTILGAILGGVQGALNASGAMDPTLLSLLSAGTNVISSLVSFVVEAYLLGGIVQFALAVARGQKPAFNVVFSGGRYFTPMLGATLLFNFSVSAGAVACLVPGLFVYAGFIAYSAFIVDRGLGAVDSLKASWQATAPYRVNLMIYGLVSILVGLAGILACCVGALLVSFPLLMIGNAYVYLKLIGEQPRLPTVS